MIQGKSKREARKSDVCLASLFMQISGIYSPANKMGFESSQIKNPKGG